MARVDAGTALPLISFEQIIREPLAPVEWLVDGVIAKGDRVMVYGEFGAFKSWLLLHLALHVAVGAPWLGKFNVPVARRVLYIDEEMHEQTLRRRVQRLSSGAALEARNLPFHVLSRAGVRFSSKGAANLLGALQKTDFKPEVIIVETFRRVLDGNENEAEDVARFWREVEPLLTNGRTLIVSHHMRKPSQQGGDSARNRASGSTDILAGSDAAYAITRQAGDSVIVECPKLRAAEEPAPFIVTVYDEGRESPMTLRYEGQWSPGSERPNKREEAIAFAEEFLFTSEGYRAKTAVILENLELRGVKKRTAEAALKEMLRRGTVFTTARGEYELKGGPNAGQP